MTAVHRLLVLQRPSPTGSPPPPNPIVGMLEVDVCRTAAEFRARLGMGRCYSALLVSSGDSVLDRDLVADAHRRSCAVLCVGDPTPGLEVDANLETPPTRHELMSTLAEVASPIRSIRAELPPRDPPALPGPWGGRLITVCGSGGTGASTIAMALAQGLSGSRDVALADLAPDADVTSCHPGARHAPSIVDLVHAHRNGRLDPSALIGLTVQPDRCPYRLVPGLRQRAEWVLLRPEACRTTLVNLTETFDTTIADVDSDIEGAQDCGAIDVEDRNLLARTAHALADLVVVVASPAPLGIRAACLRMERLISFGVDRARLVCVLNRFDPARHDLTRASSSIDATIGPIGAPPVRISDDAGTEAALAHATPLPASVTAPVVDTIETHLVRDPFVKEPIRPQRVRVGAGSWPSASAT